MNLWSNDLSYSNADNPLQTKDLSILLTNLDLEEIIENLKQ